MTYTDKDDLIATSRRYKLCVLIPTYNNAGTLRDVITDVLNYSSDVIVVNDGSTDKSGSILESFAQSDKRIVAIHKANAGVAKARNEALNLARGKFVYFIDSDDFCPSHDTLFTLYTNAVANQALICGGCFSDDKNENIVSFHLVKPFTMTVCLP